MNSAKTAYKLHVLMMCVCLQEDKGSNVELLHKIAGGIKRPDFTSGFAKEPYWCLLTNIITQIDLKLRLISEIQYAASHLNGDRGHRVERL